MVLVRLDMVDVLDVGGDAILFTQLSEAVLGGLQDDVAVLCLRIRGGSLPRKEAKEPVETRRKGLALVKAKVNRGIEEHLCRNGSVPIIQFHERHRRRP